MSNHRRGFGWVRRLPSKRFQASYVGPDTVRHYAPSTFEAKMDAEAWLSDARRAISAGTWAPGWGSYSTTELVTFGPYARIWVAHRELKPRTRSHYSSLLNKHLIPWFGDQALRHITTAGVRSWYAGLGDGAPTTRAHAYGLLRTILAEAVIDGEIDQNPCRIRGAGTAKRAHKIKPATLDELVGLAAALPSRYRLMVLLAAWCGLRFGEITELRRKDLDLESGVVHVRRGVVRVDGQVVVGTPKSDAGTRDVVVPPHINPVIETHLSNHVGSRGEALLFPAAGDTSKHLAPSSFYKVYYPARDAVGRPDLRFHDLRHTGAVLAASTGATLAELMARLGHSTPAAAMRYQHAAQDRDRAIALALSGLVDQASREP